MLDCSTLQCENVPCVYSFGQSVVGCSLMFKKTNPKTITNIKFCWLSGYQCWLNLSVIYYWSSFFFFFFFFYYFGVLRRQSTLGIVFLFVPHFPIHFGVNEPVVIPCFIILEM